MKAKREIKIKAAAEICIVVSLHGLAFNILRAGSGPFMAIGPRESKKREIEEIHFGGHLLDRHAGEESWSCDVQQSSQLMSGQTTLALVVNVRLLPYKRNRISMKGKDFPLSLIIRHTHYFFSCS